jgi:hypothetical protein
MMQIRIDRRIVWRYQLQHMLFPNSIPRVLMLRRSKSEHRAFQLIRKLSIAVALLTALLPACAIARCEANGKPDYSNITSIYFGAEGVSVPVSIAGDQPIEAGACPIGMMLYATAQFDEMGSGGVCVVAPDGKVSRCCGATRSTTDDKPEAIFARLVDVLRQDNFYDLNIPAPVTDAPPNTGIYTVAVMVCGIRPRRQGDLAFDATFLAPDPNLRMVTLQIPYGTAPQSLYQENVIRLLTDLTTAIYRSKWNLSDVY